MKEDELRLLIELLHTAKVEHRYSNQFIADICGFSASTIDRFFRGEAKRPAYEFVRAVAECLQVSMLEVQKVAPNMREGFRGDALPPEDIVRVATDKDLNSLADIYQRMIAANRDEYHESLLRMEARHERAMEELREAHSITIGNMSRAHLRECTSKNYWIGLLAIVAGLSVAAMIVMMIAAIHSPHFSLFGSI